MTYQINIIHPKAAILLHHLAELGLISIEEENNSFPEASRHTDEDLEEPMLRNSSAEKAEIKQKKGFNAEELPPITRSLYGAFEAPNDFDYKEELTKALVKKYL